MPCHTTIPDMGHSEPACKVAGDSRSGPAAEKPVPLNAF